MSRSVIANSLNKIIDNVSAVVRLEATINLASLQIEFLSG